MEKHNEFIAQKKELVFFAGKDIVNLEHTWYDLDQVLWNFNGIGFTFKIWQEREGGLLMISWGSANLSPTDNGFILNAMAADTSIERGRYYYEIEELVAGGYSVLISYGLARFI